MNVPEILKRPFLDLKKLIVGVLLGGLPILDFFVLGFALEASKKPKKGLPSFTPNQFILGLKAKVVGIFYSLIQVAFLLLFIVATGGLSVWQGSLETLGTDNFGPLMIETFGMPVFLGFILLSLVILYVSTFGIYEMVKTKSFSSGFNFIKIFREYFTLEHFRVWLVAFALQFLTVAVLSMVLTPIWWIPVLGVGIVNYASTIIFWTSLGTSLPIKRSRRAVKI